MRVVAIDGPAGSGKSTVARRVANILGWHHLDTGAFYRAATWVVMRAGSDIFSEPEVIAAVAGVRFDQRDHHMFVDGEDVSRAIRSPEVTGAVSPVSAHPGLRSLMVDIQRDWVTSSGAAAVVEGRDIGTVVFPDAIAKVFLTAEASERAKRRARETGEDPSEVETAILRRDAIDSARTISPLRPAPDAVLIDTTGHTIEEVVEMIATLVRHRLPLIE